MSPTPIYDALLERQELPARLDLLKSGLWDLVNTNPKLKRAVEILKAGV